MREGRQLQTAPDMGTSDTRAGAGGQAKIDVLFVENVMAPRRRLSGSGVHFVSSTTCIKARISAGTWFALVAACPLPPCTN